MRKSTLPVQQGSASSTACLLCDDAPAFSPSSTASLRPSIGFHRLSPALLAPLRASPKIVTAFGVLLLMRRLRSQPTPAEAACDKPIAIVAATAAKIIVFMHSFLKIGMKMSPRLRTHRRDFLLCRKTE